MMISQPIIGGTLENYETALGLPDLTDSRSPGRKEKARNYRREVLDIWMRRWSVMRSVAAGSRENAGIVLAGRGMIGKVSNDQERADEAERDADIAGVAIEEHMTITDAEAWFGLALEVNGNPRYLDDRIKTIKSRIEWAGYVGEIDGLKAEINALKEHA